MNTFETVLSGDITDGGNFTDYLVIYDNANEIGYLIIGNTAQPLADFSLLGMVRRAVSEIAAHNGTIDYCDPSLYAMARSCGSFFGETALSLMADGVPTDHR